MQSFKAGAKTRRADGVLSANCPDRPICPVCQSPGVHTAVPHSHAVSSSQTANPHDIILCLFLQGLDFSLSTGVAARVNKTATRISANFSSDKIWESLGNGRGSSLRVKGSLPLHMPTLQPVAAFVVDFRVGTHQDAARRENCNRLVRVWMLTSLQQAGALALSLRLVLRELELPVQCMADLQLAGLHARCAVHCPTGHA